MRACSLRLLELIAENVCYSVMYVTFFFKSSWLANSLVPLQGMDKKLNVYQ